MIFWLILKKTKLVVEIVVKHTYKILSKTKTKEYVLNLSSLKVAIVQTVDQIISHMEETHIHLKKT